MIYLLAIGSAFFYGAADFTGGLTTRRVGTIPVVLLSQFSGLALLVLLLPLLPPASATKAWITCSYPRSRAGAWRGSASPRPCSCWRCG